MKALGPAWTDQDAITLPLYFHWSFGDRTRGDFESLARRLRPFEIGAGEDGVPEGRHGEDAHRRGRRPGRPARGPPRPDRADGRSAARRPAGGRRARARSRPSFATPLATLLDDIADPSGTDPDDGAVGPPLYGSWHGEPFDVAGSPTGGSPS